MIGVFQAQKERETSIPNTGEKHQPTPGVMAEYDRFEESEEFQCDWSTEHQEVRGSMKLESKAGPGWRGSRAGQLSFEEGWICSDWSRKVEMLMFTHQGSNASSTTHWLCDVGRTITQPLRTSMSFSAAWR